MALAHEPGNLSIASSRGLAPPPGMVYQSDTGTPANVFVPVAPTTPQPQPGGQKRQRVFGLVPMAPGSSHPLIVREAPRVPVDRREVGTIRASLKKAEREQRAAETVWAASATPANTAGDQNLMTAARDAAERTARLRTRLTEIEAAAAHLPARIRYATAHEPAEMGHALDSGESWYVCMHDECKKKGERWDTEQAMRMAHPTLSEMVRRQETHVYAILSESPLDPLDPEGEKVGYIAPVGRDGTTVARAATEAHDEPGASAEEVSALRAENATLAERLAKMEAALAEMAKGGRK